MFVYDMRCKMRQIKKRTELTTLLFIAYINDRIEKQFKLYAHDLFAHMIMGSHLEFDDIIIEDHYKDVSAIHIIGDKEMKALYSNHIYN